MLWEYTIFCFFSLVLAWFLDVKILKVKICRQKKFWFFLGICVILQTIVDNWLNGRWWLEGYIVGPYNPQFYSNLKIFETPLENYLFGIALIWMNVAVYESLVKSKKSK
jgi:Lycopene cyclase